MGGGIQGVLGARLRRIDLPAAAFGLTVYR